LAAEPRTIVAIDYADPDAAQRLVAYLDPAVCRLKIGNELFTRAGPGIIEGWIARGFDVFLDLKYHDIPNTVAQACHAAAELGVWMVNVHAVGGRRMLAAARGALDGHRRPPYLVAVTVLTSLARSDLAELGIDTEPEELALRWAGVAAEAGCDGVVCSAREARALRAHYGPGLVIVTPGIRPSGAHGDDQRRSTGPREALDAGADYFVVGRPITRAQDAAAALRDVVAATREGQAM
jgi:orotidine-5'-phosphate decarboxylase